VREGANLPCLCQATDSSEQSQRDYCGGQARESDNCLGTQHPALSPAGSRGRAGCRYSTPLAQYKEDTSDVVAAIFLELLESL